MTKRAQLDLSGGFRLTAAAGQEVAITSRKARGALAILALSPGHTTTRARLRSLLWSDRGEQQAGDSLRQLLATLRKELADAGLDIIQSRDDVLSFNATNLAIDVAMLDDSNATELYRGELLAGLDVGDNEFESWLAAERRAFTGRTTAMFERTAAKESGAARVATARQLVAIDPLREASHRLLISALLESGEPALARKQLETCREILQRELAVSPSPETEALLQVAPPRPPAAATIPVIAVMPFANLSDDPGQRYFSEGISSDIATELARFRQFVVRTGEAGATTADYAVAGSVRRIGKGIRVASHLTESQTSARLWSERFDATEDEIFVLQDRIVATIAAQLSQRLNLDIVAKATRKPPGSLAAYECLLRGDALPIGDPKIEEQARELFRKAIALDPGYARAYAYLGEYTMLQWLRGILAPWALLDQAIVLTGKALELDGHDAICHAMHGQVRMWRRELDLAEHHYHKSLSLNPNHPEITAGLGMVFGYLGDPERGLALFDRALELDPHFNPSWYWRSKGMILFVARRYEEAIVCLERSPMPLDFVEAYLAACHAYLGNAEQARRHTAATLRLSPGFTIALCRDIEPFRRPEDTDHMAEGMRRAGIPE